MALPRKYLIGAVVLAGAWGSPAVADDAVPTATTQQPPPAAMTDEELLKLSEGEAIEIFDERPDKPFDRDTLVRLTGEQLAARGAVDLGTALALLPDVTVRDAGRGGFNIDIRGGRKGAVAILIDGVAVNDPYYGTFDVSTIPITDIVQIRVSTTPQSPIDGAGGTGGVVEVLTRDAVGAQIVVARLTGTTLQAFGLSGTARVALSKHTALRVSASGAAGSRDFELPMTTTVDEGRQSATGAARFEYRKGDRRIVVDGFADQRGYLSPPNDLGTAFLLVDRETTYRVTAKADEQRGTLQLQAQGFASSLARDSRTFASPDLIAETREEQLSAERYGGMVLATRPFLHDFRWVASASIAHEHAIDRTGMTRSEGAVTTVQGAGDLQYERHRLRLDGALGLAIPIDFDADPWPEAKVVAKYAATRDLEVTATGGYKGRVPSLRERFDMQNGNPALGPEQAYHGEVRAIEQRDRLRIEAAPFYRQTHGTVRVSTDPADGGKLVNLGTLKIYGIDLQARITVQRTVEVGGSYDFIRAKSETSDDPLDRLPHHRADAWVQWSPLPQLAALARVRYASDAIEQAMVTNRYVLVEGTLSAAFSKQYLAVLKVDDLTDANPTTRTGYRGPGRTISLVLQGTWQ